MRKRKKVFVSSDVHISMGQRTIRKLGRRTTRAIKKNPELQNYLLEGDYLN